MRVELTNATAERRIGSAEQGLSLVLTASALLCFVLWYTGRGGHGEVAFLWVYGTIALPLGLALGVAGRGLVQGRRARWWLQLLPLVVILIWLAWFSQLTR